MMKLIDGVEMNALHPNTFEIPSKEEIESLSIGDYVKVGFLEDDKNGERMWVQVTEIKGDKLKGELANDPVIVESIKFNDIVEFETKNILSIMSKDE